MWDGPETSSFDASVVVPTYGRPEQLQVCLESLRAQRVPPREIVVVRRVSDEKTAVLLRSCQENGLTEVTVREEGVIAAMREGIQATSGAIIVFTDDDAVPRRDWLERMRFHFEDASVGGVGGRDVIHPSDRATMRTSDVGRITAWGKVIGNHHLGTGPAREVMILKGTNMAFRRAALAVPVGLRGRGAQVHHEIATSLWARRRGWRLVYDPELVVDHFPGPRFDRDRRGRPDEEAINDAAYNLVASLLAVEPRLLLRRAFYGLLVGDAGTPGLTRALLGGIRGNNDILRRCAPSMIGQARALADFLQNRPVEMLPADRGSVVAVPDGVEHEPLP